MTVEHVWPVKISPVSRVDSDCAKPVKLGSCLMLFHDNWACAVYHWWSEAHRSPKLSPLLNQQMRNIPYVTNQLPKQLAAHFLSTVQLIYQLIIAFLQFSVTLFVLQEIHQCARVHSHQQVLDSVGTLENHGKKMHVRETAESNGAEWELRTLTLRVRISLWSLNSVSWVLNVRSEFTRNASRQRW